MKEPVFDYFGLYKVEAWEKDWIIMFRSKAGPNDDCLVAHNKEVQLMDCLNAVSMADSRDLFIVKTDLKILTYKEKKCLVILNGDTNSGKKIIV